MSDEQRPALPPIKDLKEDFVNAPVVEFLPPNRSAWVVAVSHLRTGQLPPAHLRLSLEGRKLTSEDRYVIRACLKSIKRRLAQLYAEQESLLAYRDVLNRARAQQEDE